MIVALTGATGFVGHAVLDEAARQGAEVRALTRRAQAARPGVEWIEGNLGDSAALTKLVAGSDAVIHVAGLTHTLVPADFEAANVAGTQALIDAARGAGVTRFVFTSSLSAREPSLSAYGASKARAEVLVAASGLDWVTVRPPGVYGPRDVDYFEMFRTAKRGFVPLPPPGATSMIYVADLARLLLALASAPSDAVRAKVFEPDDGAKGGWSHKALAREIGRSVGRRVFAPHLPKAVMTGAARADRLIRGDKARLTIDRVGYMTHPGWVVDPARAVPPEVWQPEVAVPEGLSRTADWYRRQGWL